MLVMSVHVHILWICEQFSEPRRTVPISSVVTTRRIKGIILGTHMLAQALLVDVLYLHYGIS